MSLYTQIDMSRCREDGLAILSTTRVITSLYLHQLSHISCRSQQLQHLICFFSGVCTTLRSVLGILIDDFIFTRASLSRLLSLIPGMTDEVINDLFDPNDHQNVPKAVKLLQAIASIPSKVDPAGLAPTDLKQFHLCKVLSAVIHSFVEPFINITLSLSDQVKLLAEHAHLIFALFRRHTTSFMPNQLYADTMTSIKSIIFCIAKQQILDPTAPFRLCHAGDDRIENNFAEMRTGDKTNWDILEFADQQGSAVVRNEIYSRHRNWDRGHRRLKFVNDQALDHVNPGSWKGDATSGIVSLQACWYLGKARAERVLRTANISIDFDDIFAVDGVDMLRPLGDGKYPAVSNDVDRSIVAHESIPPSAETTADETLNESSLELEDLLPEPQETAAVYDDWLDYEGKKVHKASAIRIELNQKRDPLNGKKSTDRLKRVRAFTKDGKTVSLNSADILGTTRFSTTDLAATLIRNGDQVSLAIISVTSLESKGKRVPCVELDELPVASAGIKVTGQVLSLQELPDGQWIWTGSYVSLPSTRTTSATANQPELSTRRLMTVTSPSCLVIAISPEIIQTKDLDIDLESLASVTWSFMKESLDILADGIWENAQMADLNDVLGSIPKFGSTEQLPYCDSQGKYKSNANFLEANRK